MSKNKK